MKILLVFALAAIAHGVQYDGLRVRSGWSDAMADREYFFRIPRTISEADSGHWRRTERPPGPLPELKMYCLPDRHVCPLFDSAGFVSGLQIALAVDEFESLAIPPERVFVRWRIADVDGGRTRDFWTLTQYYVTEDSLKAGAGPTIQNNNTLQDGGVWVTGPNKKLMKIPTSEAELNTTAYVKQNCIPNMGIHYYYNMTPAMNCDDSFPWFALTLRGSLIGTGFQMYGRMPPRNGERDYFERPAVPFATGLTIPLAPQCLTEWVQSYGVITMHIYYIDRPWTITCRAGDSVRPGSVQDRVLFDGVRYASSVGDQVRRVFMG